MAAGAQIHEGMQEKDFRKQLSATVRNIQWSYAIFWAYPVRQQGVLAWSDGYYNGDIKTRKTTQPMEFKADQIGLQRSEQLRELFESLAADDNNQQTRRPSASLSPEDLTATEWYYLVCMSFTFSPGQGLPGRALASNQHIWLSNAQFADSKTFSRSLLAKSASIQTVVCMPFMDGVLELGTTEKVSEDPCLLQQITTTFWELPVPVFSEQSISSSPTSDKDEEEEDAHPIIDHGLEDVTALDNHNLVPGHQSPLEDILSPLDFNFPYYALNEETRLIHDRVEELNPNICEELQNGSPEASSNDYCLNHHDDDSFKMDGLSQVHDETSNCLHGSLNSSDCVSFVDTPMILSSPMGGRIKDHALDCLQEGNYANLTSLDLDGDENHYRRTLSAILRNSKGSVSVSCLPNGSHASSFMSWRRNSTCQKPLGGVSQKLLKKVLVDASWIQGGRPMKPPEENGTGDKVWKPEGDDAANHVLSERRRREKLNEKFLILRSLVPSISKVDKASILGDTIEYLKELARRVEELESCKEIVEMEAREKRKHPDIAERTSDNYGNEDTNQRKSLARKRKACDIEGDRWCISKDAGVDINVTVIDNEVMIEMNCPWRDCLLLEIVDAISSIQLDVLSVQSSTSNGSLALTLKAKFMNLAVVSPGMVKRALHRVASKR
uniref:BHLH1 n=1 Tax=Muscari armeniacum TaxID=156613 RepID=A0A5A4HZF1_MUSAR|nr:bHLH1 [Muscari armeniacum]